jgi:hypothetical protein
MVYQLQCFTINPLSKWSETTQETKRNATLDLHLMLTSNDSVFAIWPKILADFSRQIEINNAIILNRQLVNESTGHVQQSDLPTLTVSPLFVNNITELQPSNPGNGRLRRLSTA